MRPTGVTSQCARKGEQVERSFIIPDADVRERFILFFSRLDLAKPWEIILRPYIGKRTETQNARLWKLHSLAAEVTGYTVEELHEEALIRFFGHAEKKMPSGWIKRVPLKRSSQRDKKEFGAFMEATEAFYVSELGVWLDQEKRAA